MVSDKQSIDSIILFIGICLIGFLLYTIIPIDNCLKNLRRNHQRIEDLLQEMDLNSLFANQKRVLDSSLFEQQMKLHALVSHQRMAAAYYKRKLQMLAMSQQENHENGFKMFFEDQCAEFDLNDAKFEKEVEDAFSKIKKSNEEVSDLMKKYLKHNYSRRSSSANFFTQ
jgi:hypothetical protein